MTTTPKMPPRRAGTVTTAAGRDAAAAGAERPHPSTVVVATRFVVRQRRHTVPFLRAALLAGREAEAVPGFLGGTVQADLWRRQFWTVSVWASPEAVRSYGSAPGHTRAMGRTSQWASESQVKRWRTSSSEVPPLAQAATRLGVPEPHRGLVRRLQPATERLAARNHRLRSLR